MIKNKVASRPSATLSQNAALLAFAGAVAWVALILMLHVLEPEFDPSWRMISEYELGSYGWMMQLAFFSMGLGCLATLVALWPYVQSIVGRIGLVLLAVAGFIGSGAGIFLTDPITASVNAATLSGAMHTVCGFVFILGFPIAVTLIGYGLARSQAWTPMRRWLPFATGLVWLGFLAFIVSLIIFVPGKGGFGPDVLIGLPNRFMAVSYAAWLMIAAWYAGWR
ncbi:MAG TPA: DUF998 domain-containing protein [Methanocellaceae archaeon]|jgi:hypothetical membrane protein